MKTYPLERIIADLGAAICLVLTVYIWWQVSRQQEMFPLPALYFIEVMAVSVLVAAAMWAASTRFRGLAAWAAAGLLLGFALLGAFSVGSFYLPVALLFALAGLTVDLRTKQSIWPHLGAFVLAGIVQAAVMLAVVKLIELTGL